VAAEPHSTAAPAGASVAPGVHAARVGAQVFVDGRVLVGFHDGVSATARRRIERAISTSTPRQITPALDLLPISSGHVLAAVRALKAQPEVRYAEPDYVARSSGAPNDPFFGQQWGFSNTGQLVNGTTGTAGADEHAVPAWSVATGSRSVVIAETDTGVDYNHPDLAANIWSNPGGVGGCPAGTHGYDVLTATCDPMDDDTSYGGHGTHVAGILGAQGNNGVGVSGVNWATSILPVKWLANSNDSSGSSSGLIAALDWVLRAKRDYNVNVRVVNDSATFVGTAYSQALSAEISALGQNNILFVTAAGNTGDDMTANPSTLRTSRWRPAALRPPPRPAALRPPPRPPAPRPPRRPPAPRRLAPRRRAVRAAWLRSRPARPTGPWPLDRRSGRWPGDSPAPARWLCSGSGARTRSRCAGRRREGTRSAGARAHRQARPTASRAGPGGAVAPSSWWSSSEGARRRAPRRGREALP